MQQSPFGFSGWGAGPPAARAGGGAGRADLSRVPPPPRAPSSLARELVYAYQGSQKVLRIIGMAFLLMGGVPAFAVGHGLPAEFAIAVSAVPATGSVTRAELDPSFKINKRRATRIEFRYVYDGATYHGSFHTIDGPTIAKYRPGAPIAVEAASIHPGFARARGESYSFFGWAALAFFAMPAVGAVLWVLARRSNQREIRAFSQGTAAAGRIVERTIDRSTKSNGRHPRVIKWQFEANGATYEGSISNMNHGKLDAALPGPELVVLYDPQNPAVNTVWLE